MMKNKNLIRIGHSLLGYQDIRERGVMDIRPSIPEGVFIPLIRDMHYYLVIEQLIK